MPQAVWTGDLSFGLVNIPVKLFTATSPKRVRFHQYEAGTGIRIRSRRVAEGPLPLDQHAPSEQQETGPEQWEPGIREVLEVSQEPDDTAVVADDDEENLSEASSDADEIQWEEIVKGYEIEPRAW